MKASERKTDSGKFFSKTAVCLWLAAVFGATCLIPYMTTLTPEALNAASKQLGQSVSVIIALSILQSAILLGIVTFIGLWAARALGLGAPLIDAKLQGLPLPDRIGRIISQAVIIGVICAILIALLDLFVFVPLDPSGLGMLPQSVNPPAWQGFLASFYGGIAEEIQLRLFFLSLLALGLRALFRLVTKQHQNEMLPSWIFWSANIGAAICFGLAHLPATAALLPLTPLLIVRAIVLNGLVGIVAGVLFRRHGIEIAMVCHFAADIVLHVLLPSLS